MRAFAARTGRVRKRTVTDLRGLFANPEKDRNCALQGFQGFVRVHFTLVFRGVLRAVIYAWAAEHAKVVIPFDESGENFIVPVEVFGSD